MIASIVINAIRSALNALESSVFSDYIFTEGQLKYLELFVLCARKLGNDAQLRFDDGKVSTLGSLFQRIHDALPATPFDDKIFDSFDYAVANLKKEIGNWYDTLLVSLPQPTFDEVMEIIDSVLENLYAICDRETLLGDSSVPPEIEAMIEKITFLRNFILFATLRSVEPRQWLDNLLVHIQAVAVDAAHTSYIYVSQEFDVEPNYLALLHMIRMVDPRVDETYTQALTSSKLSNSPVPYKDNDPSVIMKDFIQFLLWNLWERLHTDTPIVITTNFDLQLLYEGLRLLRSMLKKQPNKFDKKIGELTRVLICDAGVIIFSLYQKDIEIFVPTSDLLQIVKGKDFSIPNLLQMISRIRQRVEGKHLSIPNLLRRIHAIRGHVGGNDLPRTNELGYLDFVLENLFGMTSSKACYGFQSQFQMIHDELSTLRNFIGKIEGLINEQKDLENLWNAGVQIAHRVEFLIDWFVFGDFQGSSSTSFDSTVEDILKEVQSLNSNILLASDIKVKNVNMTPNPVPSQNRAPVADEIVGFDDNITSIIDRLTRGSSQLRMVGIVGMPGIGKTTLATKVFNHPYVTFHFHVRLQCCVSQSFQKKKLLVELLNLVDPNTDIEMSEQELSEKLWRHLKRRRYLIFLDDVWDIEVWDSLKTSFPDDSYKSRILVTSRHRDAVPQVILDDEPLSPRLLTEDQSWELLRKKLPATIEWSPALCQLCKQIAVNCKGLPLTVVVVAGLLANIEPQCWKIFEERISSFSGANHCMNILELSYKHLPGHLKQCFLYFGLFIEDEEVPVNRLIQLWIAEGFVRKTESKRLEDAARDYLMDLVGRSLVIVSQERSRGGVKACRIHDLLHDFCRCKAKDENFFQLLKGGYDEFITVPEPGYMRRLCVDSEWKHLKNVRLFCLCLHSLLFFPRDEKRRRTDNDISFIIPRYSRLRVLELGQYDSSSRIGILSEIGHVLQLKYLSVSGDISDIPASIGCLTNLETFILDPKSERDVLVPDTFWNLQKLRHLDISDGFHLTFGNLENFPDLCELQSCSCAIIGGGESIERLVKKFPNIRKLRCQLYCRDSNEIETLKLDSMSQLESLNLWMLRWSGSQRFEFDFPSNLRKLSLKNVLLHQSEVSRIGKLPNLEVLKFDAVNFQEDTWEMVEGEFSTLRFLALTWSEIVRWTAASDDQFPCLEKLVLRGCGNLEEIGCCFESIGILEMVEVKYCSDYVKSFFEGIKDGQMELGNTFLKIQIIN